jgi:hypothetical protein
MKAAASDSVVRSDNPIALAVQTLAADWDIDNVFKLLMSNGANMLHR